LHSARPPQAKPCYKAPAATASTEVCLTTTNTADPSSPTSASADCSKTASRCNRRCRMQAQSAHAAVERRADASTVNIGCAVSSAHEAFAGRAGAACAPLFTRRRHSARWIFQPHAHNNASQRAVRDKQHYIRYWRRLMGPVPVAVLASGDRPPPSDASRGRLNPARPRPILAVSMFRSNRRSDGQVTSHFLTVGKAGNVFDLRRTPPNYNKARAGRRRLNTVSGRPCIQACANQSFSGRNNSGNDTSANSQRLVSPKETHHPSGSRDQFGRALGCLAALRVYQV